MINATFFPGTPRISFVFLITYVKLCFQGLESALSDSGTTATGVYCDSSVRNVNPDCHIGSHSSGMHPPLRQGFSESRGTDKSSTTSASSESSCDESSDPSEESHETKVVLPRCPHSAAFAICGESTESGRQRLPTFKEASPGKCPWPFRSTAIFCCFEALFWMYMA